MRPRTLDKFLFASSNYQKSVARNPLSTNFVISQTYWFTFPWSDLNRTFNAPEIILTATYLSSRINSSRSASVTDLSTVASRFIYNFRFSVYKLLYLTPHIADVHYCVPINILQQIMCTTIFCQKFSGDSFIYLQVYGYNEWIWQRKDYISRVRLPL